MANKGSVAFIEIKGLPELIRAFNKFNKGLVGDLIWELEEAADPVRKATTEYLLGDGRLYNLPRTPYYAEMRIGVSRRESAIYVAPKWRTRAKGTGRGRTAFGDSIQRRMDRAVETKAGEVEKNLGKWLDTLADDWGSHLAA